MATKWELLAHLKGATIAKIWTGRMMKRQESDKLRRIDSTLAAVSLHRQFLGAPSKKMKCDFPTSSDQYYD